jgi:hypothetical protein
VNIVILKLIDMLFDMESCEPGAILYHQITTTDNQPTNHLTNQPTNQPANQLTDQPIYQSTNHPTKKQAT